MTETFLGQLTSIPNADEKPRVIERVFTPIFLVMLLVELLMVTHRRPALSDSLASITAGLLQNVWMRALRLFVPIVPYAWLYEHYRLFDPPIETWLGAAVCFVVLDFLYYCGHRLSHSNTFIWSGEHLIFKIPFLIYLHLSNPSKKININMFFLKICFYFYEKNILCFVFFYEKKQGHIVHHSSEHYNFSTALRQGVFEAALLWPRLLLLAVLGFPPATTLFWNEVNVSLMFFVHTEAIGKLPAPIELIFNTPSHHRVHHARNPQYIDKNYAGVFIIWDRLFGTFEEEKDEPKYGLVHPLVK